MRNFLNYLNLHLDKFAHFGVAVCLLLVMDFFGFKKEGIVLVIILMLIKEGMDYTYTYWDWWDIVWTILGICFYLTFKK